jgi:tetratricopeptide (TPR) repeat protein
MMEKEMDIGKILKEYDEMFAVKSAHEIADFLAFHVDQAMIAGEKGALLTLLNEQIGFSRDTGMKETCLTACETLRELLDDMNLVGTIHYGKSLLNISNAYRALGYYDAAGKIFPEVEAVYKEQLEYGAYEFAALYNNWSLMCMDIGEPYQAIEYLKESIRVIDRFEQAAIKQATSRVNLACAILALPDNEDGVSVCSEDTSGNLAHSQLLYKLQETRIEEAQRYIDEAIQLFEEKGGDDYHYSSALSARGDVHMLLGRYSEAIRDFTRAMDIFRLYMGETSNTKLLADKIAQANEMIT